MEYVILTDGDVLREGDEFSYFQNTRTHVSKKVKESLWEKVSKEAIGLIIKTGVTTSSRATYRRPKPQVG